VTIIKASCPTCGDIELTTDRLRFVLNSVADRSFYAFTCETCQERITKPAGPEIVRLLTLGGVQPERVDVPQEALEEHHGSPLSWDDVLDFASMLDADLDVAAAAASASRLSR
jgi:hypothetical protein